ncbi:DUF4405 domain-containing protein [Rhizobium sp. C4]|uniref:DUF4405 domain-containing protein n=1 Tax=Rhizobium sp. C4 TaxID=1349800 RepID=UPI001E403EB8|nr:DUF4405 domain-containing protein [Rhizobium sp. C4]MCD2173685.1 DUF4405 domain-containing protein [Rhizobium sp. C4]
MKDVLLRYATPSMTSLFVISLISGVIIFFHLGPAWLHGVHEWLSLLLIVPFVLHMWRNWRPFLNYFKRAAMPLSLAAGIAAVAAFGLAPAGAEGERSGPPQFALAATMLASTPAAVAPVLGVTPDVLVEKLKAAGFANADAATPMKAMAEAAGKTSADVYNVMVTAGK